jgi:hypothetical protein
MQAILSADLRLQCLLLEPAAMFTTSWPREPTSNSIGPILGWVL